MSLFLHLFETTKVGVTNTDHRECIIQGMGFLFQGSLDLNSTLLKEISSIIDLLTLLLRGCVSGVIGCRATV